MKTESYEKRYWEPLNDQTSVFEVPGGWLYSLCSVDTTGAENDVAVSVCFVPFPPGNKGSHNEEDA